MELKTNTSWTRLALLVAALLALTLSARAQDLPSDNHTGGIVAGKMGFNALPTLRNVDPVIDTNTLVEIQLARQSAGLGNTAFTPYLRIVVPFGALASLEADCVPAEIWRVGPATQKAWNIPDAHGVASGDIRFGANFLVIKEKENIPAIGVRLMTKTTTGKSVDDLRFTNGPAYYLDATAAKNIYESDGFLKRVRVLAKLGFFAWQQRMFFQDDAADYGVTVQFYLKNNLRLEVEDRGYHGWQPGDKPNLLGITAADVIKKKVEAVLTANFGMTPDAPAFEVRAGVKIPISLHKKSRTP